MMRLVPAQATDRDLVLSLVRQLYAHEEIEFAADRVGSALDRLLVQPDWGSILLIQPAGDTTDDRPAIAGYAVLAYLYSLEFGGMVALLDELWISDDWRGQGLGRRTMGAIEQFCRDRGLVALRLEVGKTNVVARSLYQSLGFQDLDRDFWTKRLD
ncbi:MAG: GNAT family N-acetyltransferase [Oscillatoriales cyanobacterium]|nr:MAG: GNAT family N-acetyltransferase [Oscillatoriales cyanobacterium]